MACTCGKRGRGNGRGESATKKKAKAAAEVVEEGNKEGFTVVEEAEVEELWIGVDEGMPWATWWLPFWEVETIGDALYGDDDVWDYDIWGLKAADTTISPSRERITE